MILFDDVYCELFKKEDELFKIIKSLKKNGRFEKDIYSIAFGIGQFARRKVWTMKDTYYIYIN
jgi:hypothetical protein